MNFLLKLTLETLAILLVIGAWLMAVHPEEFGKWRAKVEYGFEREAERLGLWQ